MTARKPDNQAKKSAPGRVQFVNINLDKATQGRLKAAPWDVDRQDAALEGLYDQGYKLSSRWDSFNSCYAAWLVPPDKGVNAGMILAGRGSTPTKAIKAVIFIHLAILEGVWGADQGQSKGEIDD